MSAHFFETLFIRYPNRYKKIRIILIFAFILVVIIAGQKFYENMQRLETPDKPKKETYIDAQEGVRLKQDPAISARTVGTLPYGTKLDVMVENGNWIKVKKDERTGWVAREFTVEKMPNDLSVRSVDFKSILTLVDGVNKLMPIEFRDFNSDGREEALITIRTEGTNVYHHYFVYGYKEGSIFTKYLDIRPDILPEIYKEGYMGQDDIKFEDGNFILTYPLYKLTDPYCCPTKGKEEVRFVWDGNKFVLAK